MENKLTPAETAKPPNPFVGPRPIQTGEKIYGRERETITLLNLLLSERIVLLHSPSGAGKTSLLQAGLVPLLGARDFAIQPVIRVNALPENEISEALQGQGKPINRYVYSMLASLSKALPEERRPGEMDLARSSLAEYMRQYAPTADSEGEAPPEREPSSPLFIFDQFEEVLTLDPIDQPQKKDFFDQLGAMLADRDLFAIFAIREDYLARLDPYLIYLPTRLKTSLRLDLLGEESARQAIQLTARDGGIEFNETAAVKLVDDLRAIKIQQMDGSLADRPGPYVEPVQLQVVCLRLWDQLPAGTSQISEEDLLAAGDVDQSLAAYYAERIASVAEQTKTPERVVRGWFHYKLITESGVRGLVLRGGESSEGLTNAAIDLLVNAHLVRAEPRPGSVWYELAHDRLINPVREDNEAWFKRHLSLLQRQAELWEREKRPEHLLLRDQALKRAKTQIGADALTQTEDDFLQACQKAQDEEEQKQQRLESDRQHALELARVEAQNARRLRQRLFLALSGLLVALVFAGVAGIAMRTTVQQRQVAETARVEADNNAGTAQAEKARALKAEAVAITAENEARDSARRALAAQAQAQTAEVQAQNLAATIQAIAAQVPNAASRVLAAQALTFLESEPDLSALLAIEAYREDATWEALNVLLLRIQREIDLNVRTYGGRLPEQPWVVNHVSLSPDGRYMAWGRADGSVLLREIESGRTALQTRHTQRVSSVEFRPTSAEIGATQYLASGGYDSNIYLWDLARLGEEDYRPERLQGDPVTLVLSLSFKPDGTQLAAGVGAWIEIFDLDTGEQIHRMKHHDYIYSLAWSPDGEWLAAYDAENNLIVWDPETEQRGRTLGSGQLFGTVHRLAWSPDSQLLAASNGVAVNVYDIRTGELVGETPKAHERGILGLDFSWDGRLLASGSSDGKVILWNIPSLRVASEFELEYQISELDFSDNEGRTLLAISGWVEAIGRLDLFEVVPADPLYETQATLTGTVSAMGVASAGTLATFSAAELSALAPEDEITAAAMEYADERTQLALGLEGGQVRLINADLNTQTLGEAASGPESRTFDVPAGVQQTALRPIERVEALAISPDGVHLAASYCGNIIIEVQSPVCSQSIIQVWELATGEPLPDLMVDEGHDWMRALAFYPDGRRLASGGYDGTLQVWDFTAGTLLGESSTRFPGGITSLAVRPDGGLLATGVTSQLLWLWDASSLHVIGDTFPAGNVISQLAFSRDGKLLYSGDASGTVLKWEVDPEAWIERACLLAGRNLTPSELSQYLPEKDPGYETCP